MLTVVDERSFGALRVRVTDSPVPEERIVFATLHDVLWLAVDLKPASEADAAVERFMLDARLDSDLLRVCAQGVALVGVAWPLLTVSRARVVRQMLAFEAVPSWMMRLEIGDVWAARRAVFGDDAVRVPLALTALHEAYVNEGPVRA